MGQEWNHDWVKYLDSSEKLKFRPLQFANAERIEHHDAVFIFDEVGCGKTISSGLIALNYLFNHKDKKVHIITTNSMVRPMPGCAEGQFLNDWYTKLPFFRVLIILGILEIKLVSLITII